MTEEIPVGSFVRLDPHYHWNSERRVQQWVGRVLIVSESFPEKVYLVTMDGKKVIGYGPAWSAKGIMVISPRDIVKMKSEGKFDK